VWLTVVVIVIGLAVGAGLPIKPAQADAGLPPRATPVPTRHGGDDDRDRAPAGAAIELQVSGVPAGAWSVVQWQDRAGNWHAVEGWQGALEGGARRWWVAAKDFGSGPFRWAVTQGPGGSVLGVSQPFALPGAANETLRVTVTP
jgi:hypothetical protein